MKARVYRYTDHFGIKSILKAGHVVLGTILEHHQIAPRDRSTASSGGTSLVGVFGALLGSEYVVAVRVVATAVADVLLAIGLRHILEVPTVASAEGPAYNIPVCRDGAEPDASKDVARSAYAAVVGIDVRAHDIIAAPTLLVAPLAVHINCGNAGDEAQEDVGVLHVG